MTEKKIVYLKGTGVMKTGLEIRKIQDNEKEEDYGLVHRPNERNS
jgi:hypothetical protein